MPDLRSSSSSPEFESHENRNQMESDSSDESAESNPWRNLFPDIPEAIAQDWSMGGADAQMDGARMPAENDSQRGMSDEDYPVCGRCGNEMDLNG
eukprot:12404160-Karenia_brevis.AAC.1